jgi:predicted NUDIX family phosphoesterase
MKFVYVVPEHDCAYSLNAAKANKGLGYFVDNKDEIDDALSELGECGFFASRNYMEFNPDYKQVIPIFMLVQRDVGNKSFILYQRKPAHTEQRLAGLHTPVFGGHINPIDYGEDLDNQNRKDFLTHDGFRIPWIIANGLFREFREETNLDPSVYPVSFNGFLYDNRDAVGRVHLGVLFTFYVTLDNQLKETILKSSEIYKLIEVNFENIDELLKSNKYPLEGWAEIVLRKFTKKV